MTLEELKAADKVIGIKQVTKAVKKGTAVAVFIGCDADTKVTGELEAMCQASGAVLDKTATMKELGLACGINVGAAAAAALHGNR